MYPAATNGHTFGAIDAEKIAEDAARTLSLSRGCRPFGSGQAQLIQTHMRCWARQSDRGEDFGSSAPSTPPTVRFRSGRLSITSEDILFTDVPQARPSQFSELGICQCRREHPAVCRMPVRLAGVGPLPGFSFGCAQLPERRKLRPDLLPRFPVDLSALMQRPHLHQRLRAVIGLRSVGRAYPPSCA